MSADRWAVCPQCLENVRDSRFMAEKNLAAAYGKVSSAEYERMRVELPEAEVDETTLREDYQIHIDEGGTFSIKFRASCRVCGFSFRYDYDEQVVGTKEREDD